MPFSWIVNGAFISIHMTSKDDFVTVIGSTMRHFFYYLLAKPILGGFAAFFIYLLGRSELLFSVTTATSPPVASIIKIEVRNPDLVFLVIAVASGFFGDKLLSPFFENIIGKIYSQSEKVIQVEKPAGQKN